MMNIIEIEIFDIKDLVEMVKEEKLMIVKL